jgi:hypothetical protein
MTQDRRCSMVPLLVGAALAIASPAGARQPTTPAQPARPAQPPKPKPVAPKPATGAAAPAPKPAAAPPTVGGVQPQLLGQFGEWGAYTASPGGHKICFALAKPAKSETTPPNRPRDPTYMFVSSRPAEKVRDEVSIIIGYGFKPNSDATLEIGGATYAMYTQNDGAWIKNAAEESRLVEAMRKAPDVTITGQSARGTTSSDIYSLKGLAQALDRANQECR